MPDPLRHVSPGDPLVIESRAWNMIVDATRAQRRARTGGAGANRKITYRPAVYVSVKNTTGGALANRAIMTPSGVVVDPDLLPDEAADDPAFLASAPVTEADPVLILVGGIADGDIGAAVISGTTVASVVVTDATHRYARPIPGNITSLTSAATGQVRLLQTFEEPDTYLCYVLLQDAAGCCASPPPPPPPPACPPSVRLPCVVEVSGGGPTGTPCYYQTEDGVIYYACVGGVGSYTHTFDLDSVTVGEWLGAGGVVAVCEGGEPVFLPGTISVTANNGTRSLEPLGEVVQTTAHTGGQWPINVAGNGVQITGHLVYCCDAPVPGLYFVGTALSTNNDPDEVDDPDDHWCGCARSFSACPPCNQLLVAGPTFDPLSQLLRLDLGCGTVDLVIGPCVAIANWDGPGYYCVRRCVVLANWAGPGIYCVEEAPSGGGGGDVACYPVYLTEADRCNTNIVICSGKHASYAAAAALCGEGTSPPPPPPPVLSCCPPNGNTTVNAAVTMPTGPGAQVTDYTVPLFGSTASRTGDYNTVTGGKGTLTIACAGDEWTYTLTQDGYGTIGSGTLEVTTAGGTDERYGSASGLMPAGHPLEGEGWAFSTNNLCGGSGGGEI